MLGHTMIDREGYRNSPTLCGRAIPCDDAGGTVLIPLWNGYHRDLDVVPNALSQHLEIRNSLEPMRLSSITLWWLDIAMGVH